ncbi:hypothetical protein [Nocardia jiangxiensis]|uniref:Uncharacterized protein n=1 Tax=Nocardia jiangxiensis TaxID=282685 RepID=A0ABW6S2W4_9NOCA|nr:hypothetical protein [Nocardia jiangxiensis]
MPSPALELLAQVLRSRTTAFLQTQFWADQLAHVRKVLARNKFDDLTGKLADMIVQFVESPAETPSDPASSSTIADQRRHEQP